MLYAKGDKMEMSLEEALELTTKTIENFESAKKACKKEKITWTVLEEGVLVLLKIQRDITLRSLVRMKEQMKGWLPPTS